MTPRDFNLLQGANCINIDEAGPTYNYYGFSRTDKSTIIMRMRVDGTEILYSLGRDYDTDWPARASLTYKRPDQSA
jgi:hypothetical protein